MMKTDEFTKITKFTQSYNTVILTDPAVVKSANGPQSALISIKIDLNKDSGDKAS